MDVLYKGGALLAAQLEGAARLAVAVPASVLYNVVGGTSSRASASASAPAPSSSRCPFSGLLGSASACPGARMAQAARSAGQAVDEATARLLEHHQAAAASSSPAYAPPPCCWWVEGRVTHVRRKPVRHAFGYDVRLALIDLDAPPRWFVEQQQKQKKQKKQGEHPYLSAGEARAFSGTSGRVLLLTLPAAAGYAQNPISVYYCYDDEGAEEKEEERKEERKEEQQPRPRSPPLRRCIAEVTNTPWGERVSFVFDPRGTSVPKSLHVSPFMDMRNVWLLKASDPLQALHGGGGGGGGEGADASSSSSSSRVVLSVLVDHPVLGRYFDAQFVGKVEEEARGGANDYNDGRSERSGLVKLWRYGFLPQRVSAWIYAHAVLLALKGVRVQPKPLAETYEARAGRALAAGGGGGGDGKRWGPIPGGGGASSSWRGRAFVWGRALSWPWYLE